MLIQYNQSNNEYNRALLPGSKYQGLNHDRPMSMAGPMIHQSRSFGRGSAGSGKATGVNAIPVGPRKPHHLAVHPMAMGRNEKLHDLSSESIRHSLHGSSREYDNMGMDGTHSYEHRLGDMPAAESSFGCMPGQYNLSGLAGELPIRSSAHLISFMLCRLNLLDLTVLRRGAWFNYNQKVEI